MHVGSQMLTFIKIICQIILYYENRVFWYFKVVFVRKIDVYTRGKKSQSTVHSLWRGAYERGKFCLKHSQRYHEEYFSQKRGLIYENIYIHILAFISIEVHKISLHTDC
jgi:hypothetical protein